MEEKNLAREELIGRTVTIKRCSDPSWNGKQGLILDETKNTFLIEINKKQKKIAKKIAKFEFNIEGKKIILEGSKIIYRPENRIKKIKKW